VFSVADSIQNKLHLQKVVMFSIPPQGPAPYIISAYVAGSKVGRERVRCLFPKREGSPPALMDMICFVYLDMSARICWIAQVMKLH